MAKQRNASSLKHSNNFNQNMQCFLNLKYDPQVLWKIRNDTVKDILQRKKSETFLWNIIFIFDVSKH